MSQVNPDYQEIAGKAALFWYAFIASIVMMSAIVWILIPNDTTHLDRILPLSEPLVLGLAGLGALNFLFAHRVHRILQGLGSGQESTPAATSDRPAGLPVLSVYLARLALLESVSVVGVLLAVVRWNGASLLPFSLLALIGVLASSPKPTLLRELAGSGRS